MNAPKRLKIQHPLNAPAEFALSDIIPIFHRWIQDKTVPGLLIDVADYEHVPNGPGILLIGDGGDYSLRRVNGQLFLVYDRKRQTGDTLDESLAILLTAAQTALQALEAESVLDISAQNSGAEITLLDRLQYPNDQQTFAAVSASVTDSVAATLDQPNIHVSHLPTDPRRPLTLQVQHDQAQEPLAA